MCLYSVRGNPRYDKPSRNASSIDSRYKVKCPPEVFDLLTNSVNKSSFDKPKQERITSAAFGETNPAKSR